mgnify:CR=1 FL=1
MSGLDIFAWIVLLILVVSAVGVFCIAGLAARAYRQDARPSAGASGNGRGLGHPDLRLCAMAGRADMGLCRRSGVASAGAASMIVAILNIYLVLLFLLVWLKIVPFNLFWKISPLIVLVLLMFGLFIPMNWGAPQGGALAIRNSVAIVPDVAGEVIDVPVVANVPLKAGDVLFRIDPTPFEAQVKGDRGATEAVRLAALADDAIVRARFRSGPSTCSNASPKSISSRPSSRARSGIWTRPSCVPRPTAMPPTWRLRKGARVANLPLAPVMAFIDTSDTIIGVAIEQIDARYIEAGAGYRGHVQIPAGTGIPGQGRERPAGDRNGPGPDFRIGRDAKRCGVSAVRGPDSPRRCRNFEGAAGRQYRRGCYLH